MTEDKLSRGEKKILKYLKIDSGGGQQVSVFDFQEMAR